MGTAGNSQPYYLGAWLAEQHACYIGDIGTETVAAVVAVVAAAVAAVAAVVVVVAAAERAGHTWVPNSLKLRFQCQTRYCAVVRCRLGQQSAASAVVARLAGFAEAAEPAATAGPVGFRRRQCGYCNT
ncbi:Hypothetical protein, no similarity [Geotrichum candidum]|uniref:Uncharacterized protein n=1 Tax=Geotrichum candidum TaxID=1173061 RepID=A0A0J9XGC1_GEOCN|nr:Hypothetical protein, no similarity [Geotrichum candidum]